MTVAPVSPGLALRNPSAVNPLLPKLLDVVLARALSKDLTKRTESAAKLSSDLQRCLGLAEAGASDSTVARSAQRTDELLPLDEERTVGGLWWLLAALGASLVAALVYWLR